MSENQDPLNQLWQQQDIEKPDLKAISKTWRLMKIKQKAYALIDVFGLGVSFVLLYFNLDKLDRFTTIYIVILILLLCPFVAYLLWLRRLSLGWSAKSTEQYIDTLKQQVKNNIRIAYITKHSAWVSGVLVLIHYLGLFYFDVFEMDSWIRKTLTSAGILVVMIPAFWIWASRREQRFKQELAKLDKLLSF